MNEVPLERRVELQNLYLRNMQEIKWRIEAIDEIRSGKRTTRFLQTNIEFCVLQIRKILELIVLSALVSDADTYKDKLGKIETMWNARLILQDIERIHPDFYPHPIRTVKDKWVDVECEYLTKDKFIKVYEKLEEMAVLNRSRFYICETCGYTVVDEKRFTNHMKKKYQRPGGQQCSNEILSNMALGYRFRTDILTMRFMQPEITSGEEALSILYGLLEGASRALCVERDDLSGCLKWFFNEETKQPNFGFVFYDKTPGGAGHVRRMADPEILKAVFEASLTQMLGCTCGGESMDTSCYSCLRNYYNQKYHDLLQRGYVVRFLKSVLTKNS